MTYKQWLDRIENLIIIMDTLPYWGTVRLSCSRNDLLELKLIIETLIILIEEREKYDNKEL